MGSKSSSVEPDPVLDEINAMTLARLKKEETELEKTEAQRQSILATGRMGMSSLLSRGFTGFKGHASSPGNRGFSRGRKTVTPAATLRARQQKKTIRQKQRSLIDSKPVVGTTAEDIWAERDALRESGWFDG